MPSLSERFASMNRELTLQQYTQMAQIAPHFAPAVKPAMTAAMPRLSAAVPRMVNVPRATLSGGISKMKNRLPQMQTQILRRAPQIQTQMVRRAPQMQTQMAHRAPQMQTQMARKIAARAKNNVFQQTLGPRVQKR